MKRFFSKYTCGACIAIDTSNIKSEVIQFQIDFESLLNSHQMPWQTLQNRRRHEWPAKWNSSVTVKLIKYSRPLTFNRNKI